MLRVQPAKSTIVYEPFTRQTTATEQSFIEAPLLRPTPRCVKPSAQVRRNRLIAINAAVASCALAYCLWVADASETVQESFRVLHYFCLYAIVSTIGTALLMRRQARLLRDGVAVTGIVTAVTPEDDRFSNGNKVTYRFRTTEGEEKKRQITVPPLTIDRFAPDLEITILYNRLRPDESLPYIAIKDVEIA